MGELWRTREYGKIMENQGTWEDDGEEQRIWEDDGKLEKWENDGELENMER